MIRLQLTNARTAKPIGIAPTAIQVDKYIRDGFVYQGQELCGIAVMTGMQHKYVEPEELERILNADGASGRLLPAASSDWDLSD